MGQKINPIIFRLSETNDWKYKYLEKKSTESALYNYKDVEIRQFIIRFFDYHGLTVQNIKLSYFNTTLNIFISYFSTLKISSLITKDNKKHHIRLVTQKRNKENFKEYLNLKYNNPKIKKYSKYEELSYIKNLKKNNKNSFLKKEKQALKLRRIKFLKYYKNHLLTTRYKNINSIKKNSFLASFFESLSKFTENKINIHLTVNKLNSIVKQEFTKKKIKILKKNVVKLRKYEQNEFFKEGLNILFLCSTRKNSAKLLSYYIASQLKKLKRHNFFLRFIKNVLILFNTKTFTTTEGIQIKIKGRFNRAPRARHKILNIGKDVPVLTLKSKIDYAETTSFTSNGTFGVKVWVCENK